LDFSLGIKSFGFMGLYSNNFTSINIQSTLDYENQIILSPNNMIAYTDYQGKGYP